LWILSHFIWLDVAVSNCLYILFSYNYIHIGAAAAGTIFTLSLYSSIPLENVATGSPDGCKFFNLYILNKPELVIELVRRAERSGFKALVVTIDSPVPGPEMGPRLALCLKNIQREPYEWDSHYTYFSYYK